MRSSARLSNARSASWGLDISDKSRSDSRMVAVGFSPRFRVVFHLASRSDARSGGECVIQKPWTDRFRRRSATLPGGARVPGAEAPGYRHAVAPRLRNSHHLVEFSTQRTHLRSEGMIGRLKNVQTPGCGVSPQKQRGWRPNRQSRDGSATFLRQTLLPMHPAVVGGGTCRAAGTRDFACSTGGMVAAR